MHETAAAGGRHAVSHAPRPTLYRPTTAALAASEKATSYNKWRRVIIHTPIGKVWIYRLLLVCVFVRDRDAPT